MLTLTDLFCGAGGSSTGAVQVPGVAVRVASNHWALAVETHEANHADTGHICADLSQIDPRYYPTTDILWASPECTNHSIAKGAKKVVPDLFNPIPDEAQERSRATMWDVPRFTEVHRYQAVVVENVVDVVRWAPFRSWLMAMDDLGYHHELVFMNSMHAWEHGSAAPQSRDRFYGVFWRKGNRRPDLASVQQPPAWCPEHGAVRARKAWKNAARAGRYRTQYRFICPETACRGREVVPQWLPAASIIDWTDLGTRIGDRAKPLAEKTMKRIQAGIDRYWSAPTVDPLLVNNVSGSDATRSSSVLEAAPTMVAGGLHASLLVPVEGRAGKQAMPADGPMRTQTARNETGLLAPFVTQFRDGGGRRNLDPHTEPLNTVVSNGAGHGVVCPPFIAELRGGSSDARPADDALATVTASGNHHALVTSYYGRGGTQPDEHALPTVTTVDTHALVVRNNSAKPGDEAHLSTPAAEPIRTVTTAGHQSLVTGGTPSIDDCTFRMLTPDEIKRAMAFPADYRILGTKREQVRMSGNAVTPPAARDLIAAVAASLLGAAA